MDSYILILFSIAVTILAIVIIAFVYFYFTLLRKLSKAQKENIYLRFHIQEKGLNKVNEAKDRAMKIIQDATAQADQIIKQTQFVENDASGEFKKQLEEMTNKQSEALKKASDTLTSSFTQAVSEIEKEDTNLLKTTAGELNKAVEEHVEEFKEQLAAETINSQKSIDEKVQEAFTKSQEEIQKYKADRINKIDQQMGHVLAEVTKEILGKRLSFDDHKDLIVSSLEKAKAQLQLGT